MDEASVIGHKKIVRREDGLIITAQRLGDDIYLDEHNEFGGYGWLAGESIIIELRDLRVLADLFLKPTER